MNAVRDRVVLNFRTGPIHGTVVAPPKRGRTAVYSDDRRTFDIDRNLPRSDVPMPSEIASEIEEIIEAHARVFKKGDRGSIMHEGQMRHGTFDKGGANPSLIFDGGSVGISTASSQFRPGPPLPEEPASVMDRWTIRRHQHSEGLSDETNAFTAEILLDGKPVLHAENSGHGGCNLYRPIGKGTYATAEAFAKDAEAWLAEHGAEAQLEADDIWLDFTLYHRPYGKTGAQFVEGLRDLEEILGADGEAQSPKP